MFQAAFGIGLNALLGLRVKLVDQTSTARTARAWALDVFGIYGAKEGAVRASATRAVALLLRLMPRSTLLGHMVVRDDDVSGWNDISTNIRIASGYWQKAALVDAVSDQVRAAFQFPPVGSSAPRRAPVVGMHIRRGDYFSDPVAAKTHLVCGNDWYRRAWELMRARVDPASLLVISDDPDWVAREVFPNGEAEIVRNDQHTPAWLDMARMAKCDHFIISNSSYSWWAAYLGEKDGSQVIAPKNWYREVPTVRTGLARSNWILM